MTDLREMAKNAALLQLEQYSAVPTSLVAYQSRGHVLIYGGKAALNLCCDFSESLVITKVPAPENEPGSVQVEGYLGAFKVTLNNGFDSAKSMKVDMFLDLSNAPVMSQQILPPGYLYRKINEQNKKEIELELLDLIGEFEKPRYFKYNASICAHGASGVTVCTNCIDACPAGAISSLTDMVEIDPYRCQGGGICATVCPSGAIQYAYPMLSDSGNKIQKMLTAFRNNGGHGAIVMFHAEDELSEKFTQQPSLLPVKVEEIASVGMELCLSALVFGASQVVLLENKEIPSLSHSNLINQLSWLKSILSGFGLDPTLVTICDQSTDFESAEQALLVEPAVYSMPADKRKAIYQAIDHLYKHIDKTRELVSLPAGAPFGCAVIDEKRCTLCMSCVGACPGKALQDGSSKEIPEIFFIESECIQCGTCTQICPEQAIAITPRIILDREKRTRSHTLNQDAPFACINCGKAFAPTSAISKIVDKLKGHYMFQNPRALDRLKMCDNCRVADIAHDPEAIGGNSDSII